MNWTLEDFYAGDKVAAEYDGNLEGLRKLMEPYYDGVAKYYWIDKDGLYKATEWKPQLPIAPLSYFISLLDAQEAAKQPEYIYEPFSEEAAKSGGMVVTLGKKKEVKFIHYHKGMVCIINDDVLETWPKHNFEIRRSIETKEVECYVYASGLITNQKIMRIHGEIIDAFTHAIKIPKK